MFVQPPFASSIMDLLSIPMAVKRAPSWDTSVGSSSSGSWDFETMIYSRVYFSMVSAL
ncbi:Uncharacterised protein [Mycobacteroides abscessus subsp. abscessus]|nr:Uncharacterised protein [Mycobacteroides abscessus subsp. abscessus]